MISEQWISEQRGRGAEPVRSGTQCCKSLGRIRTAALTLFSVKPPDPPQNAPYGLKVATAAVQLALPLRFTFAEYDALLVTMPDSLAARDEPVSC